MELEQVEDVGAVSSDVVARQKYSLLILHIVCGDFSDRQRIAFVTEAKGLARTLGRNYGISVAYASLVYRLADPKSEDDHVNIDGLRNQAEDHAKRLRKDLSKDIETVRAYMENGHGHA